MKTIGLILSALFLSTASLFAQKVFSVEYPNQADIKVYVVKYETRHRKKSILSNMKTRQI